jgi:RND family efflux transporter MFP subunit
VVVESASVDVPLALPAQLYVERDAIVAARAAGTVDTVFLDVGAHVAAGDALAAIESVDQHLALSEADAVYENVERLALRSRALSPTHGVSVADSEHIEFQLRQASLAVAKAQRALALTRVTAPFAGVVTGRWARPQRLVAVGDTMFRVTESGPLLARVHVAEADATSLAVGSPATVVGVGGVTTRATVLRVGPVIDAASGTREVVLRVTPRSPLLPGSSVSVHLGAQRVSALVVPRSAVTADGYVFVIQADRTVLRPVTLGSEMGPGRVAVRGGLSRGERVVDPAPLGADR